MHPGSGAAPPHRRAKMDYAHGSASEAMMRYDANKKSPLLAYLLWYFLGFFGAHRFYMGYKESGLAMCLIMVCSLVLTLIFIGVLGLIVMAVWWLADAFVLHGWVSSYNNALITELRSEFPY
jgi:TM2 domain-containing membrane protein YozV